MNKIKIILKEQGRSQAWLAEKIGKSYVVTTNYVNNKTQPSLLILYKVAEALNVDVRKLLTPSKGWFFIFRQQDYIYEKKDRWKSWVF